jgi:fluoride ion exporter CrcB/FEX
MTSLASLVAGQHLALYIYHKLNPGAFIPYGSPAAEQLKLEDDEDSKALQQQQLQQRQSSDGGLGRVSGEGLLGRPVMRTVSSIRRGSATLVMVEADNEPSYHTVDAAAPGSSRVACYSSSSGTAAGVLMELGLRQQGALPFAVASQEPQQRQASGSSSMQMPQHKAGSSGLAAGFASSPKQAAAAAAVIVPTDSLVEVVTETDDNKAAREMLPSVLLVDGFPALSVCLLTSISIWRIVMHMTGQIPAAAAAAGPFDDHFLWWAILFGPIGCYLRFYLSRYNGTLRGHWKWFPAGTFAANMAACVLDYVIKAAEARAQGLNALQLAILNGAVSGVGGCLSTVSTWVVEVRSFQVHGVHVVRIADLVHCMFSIQQSLLYCV